MAAILDFQSERFYLFFFFFFFNLQVTLILPTKFLVNWSFVQEMKRKIHFQDGGYGGHLGFLIKTILASSDLQVHPDTSIQVLCHLAFQFSRGSAK